MHLPDDDPRNPVHGITVQMVVYRTQLRAHNSVIIRQPVLDDMSGDAYTHQILRNRDFLVQHLHPRPDLHILPHRIVQRLQARLVPEQFWDIQHVTHEVHVPPQCEQPPSELQRVLAGESEHAS